MAAITGANTGFVIKKSTTYGTAVAGGATDKHPVISVTPNNSAETLESNNLGSNIAWETSQDRANPQAGLRVEMIAGFQNGLDKLIAQFQGTSSVPAEQTGGQADYLHYLTFATTPNALGYVSCAMQATDANTLEWPSASVTGITLSCGEPTTTLKASVDLIANKLELASAVNTFAAIAAATLGDTKRCIVRHESEFWLTTESDGTVSSADRVAITGYELTLQRPQKVSNEIKGVAGAGAPVADGFPIGTLKITMSSLTALTYFTAAQAGTTYKSIFTISGDQIGTGVNRVFEIQLPRMLLVTEPEYALADAGNNPVTMTWTLLAADSVPSGFGSVYPRFKIINNRSAQY